MPLLAAVLYGSQTLVNSSPVPTDSLATRDDGPSLIGPSKDYKTLVEKGKKVDDELLKAIEDKDKDVELQPLSDNYEEHDSE